MCLRTRMPSLKLPIFLLKKSISVCVLWFLDLDEEKLSESVKANIGRKDEKGHGQWSNFMAPPVAYDGDINNIESYSLGRYRKNLFL